MRSDSIIRSEAMAALKEKLNPVEVEKFLVLLRRDQFDYTEWQRDLWKNKSVEEIFQSGRDSAEMK
jgi:hypothetical protein